MVEKTITGADHKRAGEWGRSSASRFRFYCHLNVLLNNTCFFIMCTTAHKRALTNANRWENEMK